MLIVGWRDEPLSRRISQDLIMVMYAPAWLNNAGLLPDFRVGFVRMEAYSGFRRIPGPSGDEHCFCAKIQINELKRTRAPLFSAGVTVGAGGIGFFRCLRRRDDREVSLAYILPKFSGASSGIIILLTASVLSSRIFRHVWGLFFV